MFEHFFMSIWQRNTGYSLRRILLYLVQDVSTHSVSIPNVDYVEHCGDDAVVVNMATADSDRNTKCCG